jgi:hypothetical protein
MSGRQSQVSPLESRKQLLVAESEINRLRLLEEWRTVTQEVRELAHRTKTVAAWAAPAALVLAGVAAFWRRKSAPAATKTTWLQKLVNGARLASTCWFACRAAPQQTDRQALEAKPAEGATAGGPWSSRGTTLVLGLLLLGECFTLPPRVMGVQVARSGVQPSCELHDNRRRSGVLEPNQNTANWLSNNRLQQTAGSWLSLS